eukprot:6240572-Amphidinium_carterae.1
MEWPTSCAYWQKARVKRFLKRNNMKKVDFHGCSVGVTSLTGKPIKKPWTIATNSLEMRNVFRDK